MTHQPDDLDPFLTQHFAAHLDPQLGRSARAFSSHLQSHPPKTHRPLILSLLAPLLTTAVAASLTLALRPPQPINVPPPPPEGTLQQIVWSQTTDEGTVFLPDHTPAHKYVRHQIRELAWTDPTGTRHLQSLTPQQDILLVRLENY